MLCAPKNSVTISTLPLSVMLLFVARLVAILANAGTYNYKSLAVDLPHFSILFSGTEQNAFLPFSCGNTPL